MWTKPQIDDQYIRSLTEKVFETQRYMYYWNPERKVIRRYGVHESNFGSYAEVKSRRRPEAGCHAKGLGGKLSALFALRGELLEKAQ
jgi:hypothetical protein